MARFTSLIRAVAGMPRKARTVDGSPVPQSLAAWTPLSVVHDRHLHAGVFAQDRRGRQTRYRLALWHTHCGRNGQQHASTVLFRDELDPVVDLLRKSLDRLHPQ